MSRRLRALAAVAVLGGPIAWVFQLVLTYAFEESACAPGDGTSVWGASVRTLQVSVGAAALALSLIALAAALAVRSGLAQNGLGSSDRSFLGTFGVLGALLFALTIVLTAVGALVLATCHGG